MFKDKATIKELESLVAALQLSGTEIVFRDKRYAVTPEQQLQGLTTIIYSECYALKASYREGLAPKPDYNPEAGTAFIALLSAANNTPDRTEGGWQLRHNFLNGYLEIVKNGVAAVVPVSALEGGTPAAGQEFTVFFPKEDRFRQPTFYYVSGSLYMDTAQSMTRIYWNISSEGAPVLVDAITRKLNHYRIPFLFKCLSHPALYFRRDAAVLYVADTMLPILRHLLPEIGEAVAPYLEDDVPLFTYRYKNGIGMAENPVTQESFGMNRAAAVAVALATTAKATQQEKMQAIAVAFCQSGIDPAAPYLNKGTKRFLN